MFKIIPILMGVIISYIAALIFNARAGTTQTAPPFFLLPTSQTLPGRRTGIFPLQIHLSAILVMAPIALATMMDTL